MLRILFAAATLVFGNIAASCAETPTAVTNVPIILLTAKEPIVSDRKVPCTVQMIWPSDVARNTGALSGVVRVRGGVSQGYAKKSYGLTLKTPVRWLGMRESEHWILNAAFVDRSLMRHKLSYDLFRSLSSPDAKRCAVASRFVEVQLNGHYNGAYLLMERVDRALLGLHKFDSNAPSHACIYKAVDHAANFSQPGHAGFEQQEPDDSTKAYWGPLDEFNKFVSSAPEADFLDPQKGIAARLDLGNAIDFQLLVLLTCNLDGITKNFIIARDAVTTNAPAPRFFFVPWDYDGTFGRNWDASRVGPDVWLENHLFVRLHKDAAFRKKFAARWKELRAKEFSTATIHGLMDQNTHSLGEGARRNSTRWKMLEAFADKLSPEDDAAQMKEWVSARVQWLDAEIARRARE
jgi:spore coat protein CotH